MVGGSQCRVCVLGAGVVGMTTATLLQERRPDLQISVVADRFTVDTVSDVAAGVFKPSSWFCGSDPDAARRWAENSYAHYRALARQPDALSAGVKELPVVMLAHDDEALVRNSLLEQILPDYRMLTPEELKGHPGGEWKYGSSYTSVLAETRRYLPYLMNKFRGAGGTIVQRKVSSLEELAGEYDAVINCTGMGARALCGDNKLLPIRGQVFKVQAPWIKQCHFADSDTYIIPGIDFVTVGGCRQFNSWNTSVDRHDSASIWERCLAIMPSLRNAQILRESVGMRPYRPEVRVERELLPLPRGGHLQVVHNYGHGGYGVSCAPGTSMDAVNLLLEVLQQYKAKL